jgi:hypothetical protein
MFLAVREAAKRTPPASKPPKQTHAPRPAPLFVRVRLASTTAHPPDNVCSPLVSSPTAPPETPKVRRKRKQSEAQRTRRDRKWQVEQLTRNFTGDLDSADNLVSQLMQSPEGRRLLPSTAKCLHGEINKVREDALSSVIDLTAQLPARSRFRKDIVPVLVKPSASESFNKKKLNMACGVTDSHQRVVKHRASRIFAGAAEPLFEEKLRGFMSGERQSCSQCKLRETASWPWRGPGSSS